MRKAPRAVAELQLPTPPLSATSGGFLPRRCAHLWGRCTQLIHQPPLGDQAGSAVPLSLALSSTRRNGLAIASAAPAQRRSADDDWICHALSRDGGSFDISDLILDARL